MDDMFTHVLKNFSFTEIVCFYLLWRIENKLDAFTIAVNKIIEKNEQK